MESATEVQDPHSSSIPCPTDQPPFQQDSLKERGSEVEEKAFEEKGKTFSSQLRASCTQRRGSEPKTDEENFGETELQGGNNCIVPSESEGCSNPESFRKRKTRSRDSTRETIGASLQERKMTLENKKPKGPDAGHTSESEEIWDARPRRLLKRSRGRSKRPRSRSPGDLPPPLRKTLVTSLRTMSEAIYQDIVQVQMQQVHSPLTWEELARLAQLRGPLYTLVQTFYAMATQAAYAFPAEGWLVPAPPPGPQGPAENGGEAQSSS
ncbi:protein FRG2-like [Equus asinus]|uniref:protein FRG2-like n=1 Tax=Equus asinus TaxID=9793 RepID=UPI0038F6ED59